MAAVEEVIERLKNQRKYLEGDKLKWVQRVENEDFLYPEKVMQKWIRDIEGRIQAINYAINLLEQGGGEDG